MRPATLLSAILLSACAFGCASTGPEEEVADEGALVSDPKVFSFDPSSARERAGEVDPRNAFWAAKLAVVSYDHDTDATLTVALREFGMPFEEAFVFHASEGDSKNPLARHSGTSGIYVRTRTAGFLVFRGSEDGKRNDAIVDAAALQVPSRLAVNEATEGRVHVGFHTALHSVWEPLREKIARRHGDGRLPLYVIGHSLGGAVGTLAVHQLLFDDCLNSTLARIDIFSACKQSYIPVRALYTFGSPRTGNEKFIEMLARRTRETGTKVFRFVNEGDQVSMLPRYAPVAVVEPFRHFGEGGDEKSYAILLKKDGTVVPKPAQGCTENPKLVQCDISLWDGLDGVREGTPPWKVEHGRRIYLGKLLATFTGTPFVDAKEEAAQSASPTSP